MHIRKAPARGVLHLLLLAAMGAFATLRADACGGFFCSSIPVNQNAEQIIFRQDGDQVVALVRIQYQGDAEKFSWVVPVPGIPDVQTSSDLLFNALDQQTRPRFQLEYDGEPCPGTFFGGPFFAADAAPQAGVDGSAVNIIDERPVGPFNLQIINSDDPAALAKWLADNNYDLTDRGEELIAPYLEEGMNFLALKLRKDKSAGDLVPIKMVYKTDRPMVPIRLTAVAAEPDMGVLVWLFGPARAIPTTYPHVVVNYAKLPWLRGYVSDSDYRDLVTQAMNEAGGQGFATDFAGAAANLRDAMPDAESLRMMLDERAGMLDPAQGLVAVARMTVLPTAKLSALYAEHLPLPEGEPRFTYGNAQRLSEIFSFVELRVALNAIADGIRDEIITPYEDALPVLDGDPYLTRLFTTLSPDEMTLDPCFGYNSDLPMQPALRVATLEQRCVNDELHWQLVLGAGTGREGEVIDSGVGDIVPEVPEAIAKQSAFRDMRYLRENVDPFEVPTGSTPYVNIQTQPALCGILSLPLLALNVVGMAFIARRWRRRRSERRPGRTEPRRETKPRRETEPRP